MDLLSILIIYFIVLIAVFIVGRLYEIGFFSSIALALLAGLVILLAISPTVTVYKNKAHWHSLMSVYGLIVLVTFIVLLFYILYSIFSDRSPEKFQSCPNEGKDLENESRDFLDPMDVA